MIPRRADLPAIVVYGHETVTALKYASMHPHSPSIFTMNPTIMVVEDEPAIQDLIKINLEMGGYRVLIHGSSEEALKRIQHELPDLALLDWMLPGSAASTWRANCAATHEPERCPSSCSPPRARKRTNSRASNPAPTITSPSRFRCANWKRASKRYFADARRN